MVGNLLHKLLGGEGRRDGRGKNTEVGAGNYILSLDEGSSVFTSNHLPGKDDAK
jgi:hypothetical protein